MCSLGPCSLLARGEQESDHMQGRSFMQNDLEEISENHVLTGEVSLWISAKSSSKLP